MNAWCLANYIGPDSARILEELGYYTKEDILNAKVFDLMLIGSFDIYDVEDLLLAFAIGKYPTIVDRIFYGEDEDDEEALPESKDDIVIYGLTRNDRPNQKSGISRGISIALRDSPRILRRWRRWSCIARCMGNADCGCVQQRCSSRPLNATVSA